MTAGSNLHSTQVNVENLRNTAKSFLYLYKYRSQKQQSAELIFFFNLHPLANIEANVFSSSISLKYLEHVIS